MEKGDCEELVKEVLDKEMVGIFLVGRPQKT